jgi:hypothetical protein
MRADCRGARMSGALLAHVGGVALPLSQPGRHGPPRAAATATGSSAVAAATAVARAARIKASAEFARDLGGEQSA